MLHKLKKKDAAKDEGRQGGIFVLVVMPAVVTAVLLLSSIWWLSLLLLLLLLLVLFWFLLSSILLSRSCSINSRRGQTRWDDCPCCYVCCCYWSCCVVWFAQPKGYQREGIKPKKNLPRLSRIFRLIFLSLYPKTLDQTTYYKPVPVPLFADGLSVQVSWAAPSPDRRSPRPRSRRPRSPRPTTVRSTSTSLRQGP